MFRAEHVLSKPSDSRRFAFFRSFFHPRGALQAASFVTGVTKTGFGGVTGLVMTPMLAMILPVKEALALAVPLLILSELVTLALFWGQWDWWRVAEVLPGAVLGILLGTRLLVRIPDLWLKRAVSGLLLVFVPVQIVRMTLWHDLTPALTGSVWGGIIGFGVGFLAGACSTIGNVGGAITTFYLLLTLPKENLNATMVGTTAILFLGINSVKFLTYSRAGVITRRTLRQIPALLPLLGVGLLAGKGVNLLLGGHRIEWFVYSILALVLVMALRLFRDAYAPTPKAPAPIEAVYEPAD
jgi:hypothetical protein